MMWDVWIGLHDLGGAGWRWTDGHERAFEAWQDDAPGDRPVREECAVMNWPPGSGHWDDRPCDDVSLYTGFVCGRR